MKKNTLLIGCLALATLANGCSTAPTPAPDTRDADIQAVKQVAAAWIQDMNTKDPDKFVSYLTDDATALYPGAGTLKGKAAIRSAIAAYFADPKNISWQGVETLTVASKGSDMVYTEGTYTLTMTNLKTKKPMTDKGKYLTIFVKQADGSWKAVADTFNSDSAM
jgi:uncharacterized protein (TIGR02246 family)